MYPLLRALTLMTPSKGDPWVAIAFTASHMIVHHATDDMSTTATATIPKEIFTEFAATTDCRFMLCLSNLTSSLQLCTPYCTASVALMFAFPTADGKCVLEVCTPEATVRTLMLTRPVKDRLLDLRFHDALCPNRMSLRGDVLKEAVNDVAAMTPDHVQVSFSNAAACIMGSGGIFGAVTVEISRNADGVINFESGDDTLHPKYLSSHAVQAFGGSNNAWFDRVTLCVNTERQLCVSHHGREHDADVQVQFVVQPLANMFDIN